MSEYNINKSIKETSAIVISEIEELLKLNTKEFQDEIFNEILEIISKNKLDIEEFIEIIDKYPSVKVNMGLALMEQHYVDNIVSSKSKDKILALKELF